MTFAVTANEKGKKVLTMAEYIERETAIAWFMPYAHAGESIDADVVISDIKGMKAADVAPVRHGHLISTGMDELWAEFGNCTECGGDNYIKAEFCNWCGAKLT